jgi:hypothetical protein
VLQRLKIKPHRSLDDDMQITTGVMSYGGGSQVSVPAGVPKPKANSTKPAKKEDCGCGGPSKDDCHCHDKPHHKAGPPATPDFTKMSAAEKLAWNKAKRDRMFGSLTV